MVLKRSLRICREEGPATLFREGLSRIGRSLRRLYAAHVRPRSAVADERVRYNGVIVRPYREIDRYFPLNLPPNQGGHEAPDAYEQGLVDALRRSVSPGDRVTVVGGGLGVTAVVASRAAGPAGSVTVYEASGTMLPHLRATLAANETPADVTVIHGIVGRAEQLDGTAMGAQTVDPGDLDACDVLEMDCEGAEVDILGALTARPERIIVETHGNKNHVVGALGSLGYVVERAEVAERGPYEPVCRRSGIEVLTAARGS